MNNSFEWLLAWRYTRGSRGANSSLKLVSFVSWLSMIGTVIGVASLIVVMSVMNGFVTEIRDKMLSVVPHVQVYPSSNAPEDWAQNLTAKIKQNPEVIGVAPYMSSASIILQEGDLKGIKVEGIDPEFENQVSQVGQKLIAGQLSDLQAGQFNIIIGSELANHMGVQIGDKITIMAPEIDTSIAGATPRMREFNLTGVIYTDHFEVDNTYAFMNVDDARSLFHNGSKGLRIKLKDMNQAESVADWIDLNAGMPVVTQTWTSFNPGWFSAVKTEKVMISIILLLIVAVAAFNIISTLVMVVTDKKADIAILRTLGATPRQIMTIFMVQGTVIGVVGTLLGAALGSLAALYISSAIAGLESLFGFKILNASVYFIDYIPSQLLLSDVLLVSAAALFLSFFATLYPAWRAARTQPAEALRYE